MLELRNKMPIIIDGVPDYTANWYFFDVFHNGKKRQELIAEMTLESGIESIRLQVLTDYDENIVWKEIENEKLGRLVLYQDLYIDFNFDISGFYNWKYFYFPYQYLTIQKKDDEIKLIFWFALHYDETPGWTYKFTPNHVIQESQHLENVNDLRIYPEVELGNKSIMSSFHVEMVCSNNLTINEAYSKIVHSIQELEGNIIDRLENFRWKTDYQTNEKMFTLEVIIPLLRKMKFDSVKYIHGVDEYGRDATFSENNKFSETIYYGLQAKAGDISGGTNSLIDTIISQIETAFRAPFKELGDKDDKFIHFFIVATSGNYTKQAKEKILFKVPEMYKNHISFWDHQIISGLLELYWKV